MDKMSYKERKEMNDMYHSMVDIENMIRFYCIDKPNHSSPKAVAVRKMFGDLKLYNTLMEGANSVFDILEEDFQKK